MSKNLIHPTAIISDGVKVGEGTVVGPYSIIDGNITIGKNCQIHGHAVLKGSMSIGDDNQFFQFCSIGESPQDISYKGEDTRVEIGNNNIFREYVSVHRGTLKQDKVTIIGNNNLLMAHAHIGHDSVIGSDCIIVNSANIAGHVRMHDRVIMSGACAISQHVTIGKGVYIGGSSSIDRDLPSYCTALGNRAKIKGINIVGLRRQGFPRDVIAEAVEFLRAMEISVYSPRSYVENEEEMSQFKDNEVVQRIAQDISQSKVGIASFSS